MNILHSLLLNTFLPRVIPVASAAWRWFDGAFTGLLGAIAGTRLLTWLRNLLRMLWVCRIAAGSIVLGWLLLQAPQSRDLFLDLSHDPRGLSEQTSFTLSMILHSLKVLVSLVFFWVMPVYISALWSLDHWRERTWPDAADPDDAAALRLADWIPAILALIPFVLLAQAVLVTESQLFQPDLHPWSGVAAHQLLAHLLSLAFGALAFLAVIRAIAVTSRRLDAQAEAGEPPRSRLMHLAATLKEKWETVLFALFAVVLAFTLAAVLRPAMVSTESRLGLLPAILGGWIPVLHLLSYFSIKSRLPLTALTIGLVVFIGASTSERFPVRLFDPTVTDPVTEVRYDLPASPIVANRYQMELLDAVLLWMRAQKGRCGDAGQIRTLLSDKAAKAAFVASGDALKDAHLCPNPIIVAAAGGASRAAFQTVTVLGHLLDITCPAPAAHGMAIDSLGFTRLTSEGGAFESLGSCPVRPEFAERLFAISGVSGGAFGAAVYAAAWANALPAAAPLDPDGRDLPAGTAPLYQQPCVQQPIDEQSDWFGNERPEILPRRPVIKTWRDCLQAIVAGDFLSPAIAGLAFRDQNPFGSNLQGDRAAQLENVWIERFANFMHPRTKTAEIRDLPPKTEGEPPRQARIERHGHRLSNSFATFLPTPDNWRPLLLMNGTSATTGRRLLTSHIAPEVAVNESYRLFPEALDLREVVGAGKSRGGLDLTRRCQKLFPALELGSVTSNNWDVSLATAATNSARFPLISPPGAIGCAYPSRFNLGYRADVFDKVIDGGYFENYGLQTALDVVQALEHGPFGLRPLVLVISNDPITPEDWRSLMAAENRAPPAPDANEVSWFDGLVTPAAGLYNTRNARGFDAFSRALDMLDERPGPDAALWGPRVYHFSVFHDDPAGRSRSNVSMSWWLSKPVQEFIDNQSPRSAVDLRAVVGEERETPGRCINRNEFIRLCRRLGVSPSCHVGLKPDNIPLAAPANGGLAFAWQDRCLIRLGGGGN